MTAANELDQVELDTSESDSGGLAVVSGLP